jgi:predicted DNA-binding protein
MNTKRQAFSCSYETDEALHVLAAKQKRTFSQMVRVICEEYIEANLKTSDDPGGSK